MEENKLKVKVYSMVGCVACSQAKLYLKNRGVAFEDVMVTDEETVEWLVSQTGMRTVPQILVSDTWIVGYNQAKLADALDKEGL